MSTREGEDRAGAVFGALSDPTRRRVLELLRERDMTAGELAAHFSLAKPTMSGHFAVLKQADLVTTRRDGQQIYYALNTTVVEDLLGMILNSFSTRRGNGESKR